MKAADVRALIEQNKGSVFLYVDPTIPCQSRETIMEEYRKAGKEFLVSNNGDGSCVFGVHAHWLIPAEPKMPVIDWVRKYMRPLTAESGIFAELAAAARAKEEERKSKMAGNVFFHTGDLGDIIAALPTIRALGGGYLILGNRHGRGGRELMTQARFDVIAPLLAAQSYIAGVELMDDAPGKAEIPVTHDFTRFREHAPPQSVREGRLLHGGAGYNLATWQASYFGLHDVDLSPWLTVQKNEEALGKTIFARTERYHNPKFDWAGIVAKHWPALFVGLEEEWKNFSVEFCRGIGIEVSYRPCGNLLEVAQLIAGSRLLVCNQTVTFWMAAGLGHPLIQESDQWNLNSVVERTNATYIQ